jgi:hypothetical protein
MISAYDDRIYSPQLVGRTTTCPECGHIMRANGYLRHLSTPGRYPWAMEFECSNEEGVIYTIHEMTKADLIDAAVREAGRDPRV